MTELNDTAVTPASYTNANLLDFLSGVREALINVGAAVAQD